MHSQSTLVICGLQLCISAVTVTCVFCVMYFMQYGCDAYRTMLQLSIPICLTIQACSFITTIVVITKNDVKIDQPTSV